jgi:hypothetical protein
MWGHPDCLVVARRTPALTRMLGAVATATSPLGARCSTDQSVREYRSAEAALTCKEASSKHHQQHAHRTPLRSLKALRSHITVNDSSKQVHVLAHQCPPPLVPEPAKPVVVKSIKGGEQEGRCFQRYDAALLGSHPHARGSDALRRAKQRSAFWSRSSHPQVSRLTCYCQRIGSSGLACKIRVGAQVRRLTRHELQNTRAHFSETTHP